MSRSKSLTRTTDRFPTRLDGVQRSCRLAIRKRYEALRTVVNLHNHDPFPDADDVAVLNALLLLGEEMD